MDVNRCKAYAIDRYRVTDQDIGSGLGSLNGYTGCSVALLDEELAKLSEEHRTAFTLYYGQGLSCADVAAALQISPAEAKGRLAYARKLLRNRLSGRVPEATSSENRK